MPYTIQNPPERIKSLPKHAQEIFISAFNNAIKQYKGDETRANKVAWAAVKNKYKKVGDRWLAKTLVNRLKKALPKKPPEKKPLPPGAHRTPPKGYPSSKEDYAIPNEFKYPLKPKSRCLAAWRYFMKPENQRFYSSSEIASIKARIKSYAKKHYNLELKEGIKKTGPFNLYFSLQKTFNKDMEVLAKELNIAEGIPEEFAGIEMEPGLYSYGIASTEEIDTDGEKIVIDDEIINGLSNPPYNKIFLSHDNKDIASGVIKFSGRIPELDNQFYIVERINEHHPMFKNIVGSIQNGYLDSYSVAGEASLEYDPVSGSRVRKVTSLREVSRTSYPANPDAGIQGMFFVKTANGGFLIKKEDIAEMNEEDLNKALEPLNKTLEELKKRLESVEKFQKDLEDKPDTPAADENKGSEEGSGEETGDEETKEEEKKEDIEKMIDKKLEEFKKSLGSKLEERKSEIKDESKEFEKTSKEGNSLFGFLKDPSKTQFVGGA